MTSTDGFSLSALWGSVPQSASLIVPEVEFTYVHVASSFRMAFRMQRAVVILDSFYCWRESLRKPIRVHLENDELLAVPCLYFPLAGKGYGFVMITRAARKSLRDYCDHEPVVFDHERTLQWLEYRPVVEIIKILQTSPLLKFSQHVASQKIFVDDYNGKELHKAPKEQYLLFDGL